MLGVGAFGTSAAMQGNELELGACNDVGGLSRYALDLGWRSYCCREWLCRATGVDVSVAARLPYFGARGDMGGVSIQITGKRWICTRNTHTVCLHVLLIFNSPKKSEVI